MYHSCGSKITATPLGGPKHEFFKQPISWEFLFHTMHLGSEIWEKKKLSARAPISFKRTIIPDFFKGAGPIESFK